MSDPRYMIELSRRRHADGSEPTGDVFAVIGELNVGTTDPIVAADLRDELKARLSPDFTVVLYMVEEKRSRVIAAITEDHFRRPRPDRSAAVALAVDTPVAVRSLHMLDDALSGNAGALTLAQSKDIALTLEHYNLSSGMVRAWLNNGTASDDVLRDALLSLSTLVRSFPIEHIEPVDTERWLAVCMELRQHSPDALSKPDATACQAEAELDFLACEGRVVEITFVNGYKLGTNDQNDLVTTAGEEPPFRVIVCGMDPIDTQWADDTLDPKWDVRPAPDETRLDGLRSLWTFGPSYRDATLSQKEG